MSQPIESKRPLILFDGVCNLCNSTVNFVIDHDKEMKFYFGTLQSEHAKKILSQNDIPDDLGTILLIDDVGFHTKSNAILRIIVGLGGPWKLATALWLCPRPIRDFFYSLVARSRYAVFGKLNQCRVPTPELLERFI